MEEREPSWLARTCVEPVRDMLRRGRFSALRGTDLKLHLAYVAEAGRAAVIWHSPYVSSGLRIVPLPGQVCTCWDQPAIMAPAMAWDALVIALAAPAAVAPRTRAEDVPDIHPACAARALRLADSLVRAERVTYVDQRGKTFRPPLWQRMLPPPWPHPPQEALDAVTRLYGAPLPRMERRALASAYAHATHLLKVRHARSTERLAALAWERGTRGHWTEEADIAAIMGSRPISYFRTKPLEPPNPMDAYRETIARERRRRNPLNPEP